MHILVGQETVKVNAEAEQMRKESRDLKVHFVGDPLGIRWGSVGDPLGIRWGLSLLHDSSDSSKHYFLIPHITAVPWLCIERQTTAGKAHALAYRRHTFCCVIASGLRDTFTLRIPSHLPPLHP